MKNLKAVVFDFFGTLVPNFSLNEHTEIIKQMADLVHAPQKHFVERWFETFRQRALGEIPNVASNILIISQELNLNPKREEIEEAVSLRFSYERNAIVPRESVISTLRVLKDDGYSLGLITDCSSELPQLWEGSAFSNIFDVTVFSCTVGLKKPNPKIYQLACDRLKVDPRECLYAGDGSSKELTGAKAVGMYPILLLDESEKLNLDVHRIDGERWNGPTIGNLNEVFDIIKKLKK